MVNSVLSSLVTFYMCSIKVPITILDQIDKYMRHCLWRGETSMEKSLLWLHKKWLLNQNLKDDWTSLTLGCLMKCYSCRTCTNSITRRSYPGYNLYGQITIEMGRCRAKQGRSRFSGKII
jgi:hypothetical protein